MVDQLLNWKKKAMQNIKETSVPSAANSRSDEKLHFVKLNTSIYTIPVEEDIDEDLENRTVIQKQQLQIESLSLQTKSQATKIKILEINQQKLMTEIEKLNQTQKMLQQELAQFQLLLQTGLNAPAQEGTDSKSKPSTSPRLGVFK